MCKPRDHRKWRCVPASNPHKAWSVDLSTNNDVDCVAYGISIGMVMECKPHNDGVGYHGGHEED